MEKIWLKNWPTGVPQDIRYLLGEKPLFRNLRAHAKAYPDRAAINFYGKEVSYAAFDRLTDLFRFISLPPGAPKRRPGRLVPAELPTVFRLPDWRSQGRRHSGSVRPHVQGLGTGRGTDSDRYQGHRMSGLAVPGGEGSPWKVQIRQHYRDRSGGFLVGQAFRNAPRDNRQAYVSSSGIRSNLRKP